MESQTQSPIDLVISRLQRCGCEPKSIGAGKWKAKCPAHRGSRENLTISDFGETVGLHCFHVTDTGQKSCPYEAIVKALDLERQDLYPRKGGRSNAKKQPDWKRRAFPTAERAIQYRTNRNKRPPACYWTYWGLDTDGKRIELMRVYRYNLDAGEKDYAPVNLQDDGWHIGDAPGKLPLYNLPDLKQAETVFVAEGEKCADIIMSMSSKDLTLVATTSAHGAGSAARTDWTPLAGKNVILLPDNNVEGEGYVSLTGGVLAKLEPPPTIRVLRLPNLEKGWDVQQWMQEVCPDQWTPGDCGIELMKLASNEPIWVPPPNSGPVPKLDFDNEGEPGLTELGNSRRLLKRHGSNLRFCSALGKWLHWNDRLWEVDEDGTIWHLTKGLPKIIRAEAAKASWLDKENYRKWANKSEGHQTIAHTIKLSWSEPGIGISPDQLDSEDTVLNCPNGLVELQTGKIRKQVPEDFVSKMTAVPCDFGDCPRWIRFLEEVFLGDQEMINYMKCALGYSLYGITAEQALFVAHGPGGTGKSTLFGAIRRVLGTYATVCNPRLFLPSGQDDHPTALADLAGKRFVLTSELERNEYLAEAFVKRVTGERTMKGRFMCKDFFEFTVRCKIWMMCNSLPQIDPDDRGMWRRLHVIPFERIFEESEQNKDLSDSLVREEGPQILGWLVSGAVEYNATGLEKPKKVMDALKDYRSEVDLLMQFLEENYTLYHTDPELKETFKVPFAEIYARYLVWFRESGEKEKELLTRKIFGIQLTKRGFPPCDSNSKSLRKGLTPIIADDHRTAAHHANGNGHTPQQRSFY
jgi:putative DNA primase/helicase